MTLRSRLVRSLSPWCRRTPPVARGTFQRHFTSKTLPTLPNLEGKRVQIVEVGPRDGLQNEGTILSVEDRVELIRLLAEAGCTKIEAGSFVSDKYVPAMANTAKVVEQLQPLRIARPDLSLCYLVPTPKFMEQAIDAGVDEIAIFASNINCTIDESIERFKDVAEEAQRHNIAVRGYLSCIFSCPYDGDTDPRKVGEVTERLLELGCYEVSLGDTIGTGTPERTQVVLEAAKIAAGGDAHRLAVHFHDTHGRAIDNIRVALAMGFTTIDSSVAGLGGCPYAMNATGNVATESVLALLESLGVESGIDMAKLKVAADFVKQALGKT